MFDLISNFACMLDVEQILNVNTGNISNTVMTKIVSNTYLRVKLLEYHLSHGSRRLNKKSLLLGSFGIERFSLDCRKTKTKVNTLANQRA